MLTALFIARFSIIQFHHPFRFDHALALAHQDRGRRPEPYCPPSDDIDIVINDEEFKELPANESEIFARLKVFVLGKKIQDDPIPFVHVHLNSPQTLFDLFTTNRSGDYLYFYSTSLGSSHIMPGALQIPTPDGYWLLSTAYTTIEDKEQNRVLGFKRNYKFYTNDGEETNFNLCEYRTSHLAFEKHMVHNILQMEIDRITVCEVQRNTSVEDNNADRVEERDEEDM